MNRNFLIIVIAITIIAVGAVGFIFGKYYSDVSKKATEIYESGLDAGEVAEKETEECAGIENISEKNQCWTDLAKETKDENYCRKISTDFPEARGDCYTELAILKDDSLICEKIDSSSLHKSCLEYFEGNDEKDEMADWKSYQNENFDISFKYPSDWKTPEYTKIEEHEDFGSYGIQDKVDFNSQGYVRIIDKNKFKTDYQQCLKTVDEGTCGKSFGGNYNELLKQMSFIENLRNKNLTDNKYSHCYNNKTPCSGIEGFDFNCNAIGGYITLRTIHNDNLNVNTARAIGFCGYDVGIQNYSYYVPLVINDKLVEIQFKLFPYNSAVYEWGNKEQGYDEAKNWEKFSDEFRKSLWENKLNQLVKEKINQYDLLIKSISIEN